MSEDQKERMSPEFFSEDPKIASEITKRELRRIEEVLEILKLIKTPSTRNVGMDGSRAIWLIALHNFNYKSAGTKVLKKMKQLYYRDKNQVFYPGIPFLVDRIMVGTVQPIDPLNLPKQIYGTQGLSMKLEDGTVKSVPFPIRDYKNLHNRRKKFGLSPKTPCKHQT